jgi:hypothetical protein
LAVCAEMATVRKNSTVAKSGFLIMVDLRLKEQVRNKKQKEEVYQEALSFTLEHNTIEV